MDKQGYVTPDDLPVAKGDLEDLIAGQVIVHLWLEGTETLGFIPGVPTIAFEMQSGDVHVMAALPDVSPASPFAYRLLWRLIARPVLIRKSRVAYYRIGDAAKDVTEVQQKARGQLVRHVRRLPVPNRDGGEILELAWSDGRVLRVEGVHSTEAGPGEPLAGLELTIVEPERRYIDLGAGDAPRAPRSDAL